MKQEKLKAHAAVLSANVLYGVGYVVVKGVMPAYLSALALTLFRICLSTSLFWLVGMFMEKSNVERKDLLRIAIAGIMGVGLNQFLFLKGLSLSSAIDSSIVMTTSPIMVLLISALVLRDHITFSKVCGIVLGVSGALLLVFFGQHGVSSGNALGISLLVANSFSYAIYLVILKPIMHRYDAVTMSKWLFLFGSLAYFPFGIGHLSVSVFLSFPTWVYFSLVFIIIGTTFFTYLLNVYALKIVKATTVSVYIYTQPAVAAVVVTLLGLEVFTWTKALAAVLVFAGVYLVSFNPFSKKK
jgi:drug/metabolite transporter (DMT)-like permease